ncbi:ATP-grasp domain-containing protein [Nonomuraea soli]|uniref:NAD(P)-dependent dehydrogenase (Short-subunit alcohol dehydrogenase family) n=1 Tax=Nonomuraea soli TaxID=1032476 RepID=A0A7W0CTR6_9ACTN|nr:ATP-grasp domain-containing protein [Nonomuraea soli]MBA2897199.1 NAD(P)-dependent dehydrogenase (short-subunit alcohol dehydrogenase family) [Nonomuraea soli]
MTTLRDKVVLITGGRAPVALDLARKFAAGGARVLVAESASANLCGRSRAVAEVFRVPPPNRAPERFVRALVEIVRRERVELLVPTCEEIFWVARGRDELATHCHVLAAGLEELRGLHSKWEFVQKARGHGLPVPETRLGEAMDRLPYIVKPEFSRFATKVRTVRTVRTSGAVPKGWVAQELLEGRQLCTYSVADRGRLVAHAAYEVDFTASGACVNFAPVEDAGTEGWVTAFLAAERFSGQVAFDFIDGVPLECNPRATSGVHLFGPELAAVMAGAGRGGVMAGTGRVGEMAESGRVAVAAESGRDAGVLRPEVGKRAMIATAMLSFGLWRMVREPRRWLRVVREAEDVIAVPGDRGPFLSQFEVVWHNWLRSLWTGRSLVECSTYDIEWDGR